MKRLACSVLLAAAAAAGQLQARPVWKASPPDARSVTVKMDGGAQLRVDVLADNLFRVRRSASGVWTEGGLNRYGIIREAWPEVKFERSALGFKTSAASCTADPARGTLHVKSLVSAADFTIDPRVEGKGFAVSFSLAKGERVYGLGDCSRDELMRRGKRYEVWVRNVKAYIPVPMAISRNGWGLLVNSTWRHFIDVGAKNPDAMLVEAKEGDIDFYVFLGADYRALLDAYTRLSGRPALLPVWGYGFTYVANQNIDQYNVVNECLQFRDRELPGDVYGLEPGWMSKHYDYSIYKEWHPDRFYFPYWAPIGGHTWISAMKRLGFKLSLWLCCDYDLFRYEEQCAAGLARKSGRQIEVPDDITDTWEDDRIGSGTKAKDPKAAKKSFHKAQMYRRLNCPEDDVPDGMLPWFEHLKKFVDQGAQCFKLDGSNQVAEHPGRAWANGCTDEEMHNLYPLVYDKQMARGYESYTKRRSMVYSAGGYAGVQQFVATWAGDTGGGPRPLASLLNLAASGHSNQSCDMSVSDPQSLHFGFLQTWSQQNNWDYWKQPWLNPPEKVAAFRAYSKLRYRLLPYIYTAAAEAALTGWPVMRALALEYPDNPDYDKCLTTYMFGPNLLVSAFAKKTVIPPGLWQEWRTGETVKGPCERPVEVTEEWGGGLYVKAGTILPTWPQTHHVEKGWNDRIVLHVWPTADGTASLYEDDGISLEARDKGAYATTPFSLSASGALVTLTIGARKGKFAGMCEKPSYTAVFHLNAAPAGKASFCGKELEGKWDATAKTFSVDLGKLDLKSTVALSFAR